MSLDHASRQLITQQAGYAARAVLAPLLLTAVEAAPSTANEAWTRHEGTAPQTVPHGLRCSDAVVIGGRQAALVCRAPGRADVGLYIASGSAAAAPLLRLETWTGAFNVLHTPYTPAEGAPGCPSAAAARCTAGVVLADVYDETCVGTVTVVLAVDPSGRVRRTGHVSEVLTRDGETACAGRDAAVRTASPAPWRPRSPATRCDKLPHRRPLRDRRSPSGGSRRARRPVAQALKTVALRTMSARRVPRPRLKA